MVLMVCVGPGLFLTVCDEILQRYEPRESWDRSVDYLLLVFDLRCGVCVHLILSEKGGPNTKNIVLGNVAGYFNFLEFFFLLGMLLGKCQRK